jgi:hypothetical protein
MAKFKCMTDNENGSIHCAEFVDDFRIFRPEGRLTENYFFIFSYVNCCALSFCGILLLMVWSRPAE